LVVALREPCLRFLRDGNLLPRRVSLAADAVALAMAKSTVYVALTDLSLSLYDIPTLSRQSGIPLPAAPLAMTSLPHPQGPLVAVALRNCSVVVYHGTVAISRHETDARVLGLHGGVVPHMMMTGTCSSLVTHSSCHDSTCSRFCQKQV
jgi:hypothetical protein